MRVQVLEKIKDEWMCASRVLSEEDEIGQCDACDKQHNYINVRCSMNSNTDTKLINPAILYDFKTGAEAWRILSQDEDYRYKNGRVLKKGHIRFIVRDATKNKKTA